MLQNYDKKKVTKEQIKLQVSKMTIEDVQKVVKKLELKMNFKDCLMNGVDYFVEHLTSCESYLSLKFDKLEMK